MKVYNAGPGAVGAQRTLLFPRPPHVTGAAWWSPASLDRRLQSGPWAHWKRQLGLLPSPHPSSSTLLLVALHFASPFLTCRATYYHL